MKCKTEHKVRLGVIGLGNIALQHITNLRNSEFNNCEITGDLFSHSIFVGDPNQRDDAIFLKMKALVQNGAIGEITRTHWTNTNWFRPDIYFQVSDWRATFKGEGGGLLVNQCIHNLDIFQWICGLPTQVTAFCEFGKYHNIEVEDEVSAFLRYSNNASGVFIASTGETPGVNRFDIVGNKGSLHLESGVLKVKINSQSSDEFCQTSTQMFGAPEVSETVFTEQEINSGATVNQHLIIMNNFINAILHGEALIAPAREGLASLDIANAMLLSTWQQKKISLPLDRKSYQVALAQKIQASSLRTKSDREATIDMSKSYR